jgi:hypothetical protein
VSRTDRPNESGGGHAGRGTVYSTESARSVGADGVGGIRTDQRALPGANAQRRLVAARP